MVRINEHLVIDDEEIRFSFVRSSGPGGQNVNKLATKAVLSFDVAGSSSLSGIQKARLFRSLANRISKQGELVISRSRHRTQAANRREAVQAFVELVAAALRPSKPRKQTQPTVAANRRRLETKRRRSLVKEGRRERFCSE